MPRNMSFALTIEQVRDQSKTVTRRQGWNKLKVGDLLQPVVKGMGIPKGGKVEKIGDLIRVLSVRKEIIFTIEQSDVILEGFPNMHWSDFVVMYCKVNKVDDGDECNRIEFEYVNEPSFECRICKDTGMSFQDEEGGKVEFFCDCELGESLLNKWVEENPEYK